MASFTELVESSNHHHHEKINIETVNNIEITSSSSSAAAPAAPASSSSRYENQKRRDWNTFGQYLRNHRPPLTLSRCSGAHVLEFLRYLDQFGKTKVHTPVGSSDYILSRIQ
ncbi:hypothetical protein MTR67_029571 [Solanum verrucosum]|uniref:ALOG domain-containing protein n=1 Tax=Solanum verrucosum TaxID=315347 RepID=A0AAF0TXE4_SOLVR|nr:hypothetical protein MTR67_029571 [Solanum verrucosum]